MEAWEDPVFESLRSVGHDPAVSDAVWRFTANGQAVFRGVMVCAVCRAWVAVAPKFGWRLTRSGRRRCNPRSDEELRRQQRREEKSALVVMFLLLVTVVGSIGLEGVQVLQTSPVLGLIFAGLGLPMAIIFAVGVRKRRLLRRVGSLTTGTAIDTKYVSSGQGGGGYRSTVRFFASDGSEHSFKTVGNLSNEVEVVYDPQSPRTADVAQNLRVTVNDRLGIVFFGGLVLGGIIFFLVA